MNDNSVNKDDAAQNESFTELMVQLAKTSSVVVHDEIVLVIQRIRETIKAARNGILLIATGAVIGFAAFMCLCAALIIDSLRICHPSSLRLSLDRRWQ